MCRARPSISVPGKNTKRSAFRSVLLSLSREKAAASSLLPNKDMEGRRKTGNKECKRKALCEWDDHSHRAFLLHSLTPIRILQYFSIPFYLFTSMIFYALPPLATFPLFTCIAARRRAAALFCGGYCATSMTVPMNSGRPVAVSTIA